MKIVISHVYSQQNNGDAAILSAQISMLRSAFHNPQMHILSVESILQGGRFENIPVCNSLMYGSVHPGHSRARKALLALAMMTYTALWAQVNRVMGVALPLPRSWREPMRILLAADVQVCVGGGYLRAHDDLASTVILALFLHQIWLAKALGKPVYLCAQSFGPYPQRLQRMIAKTVLLRADLILVREAKSRALLESLGIGSDRVMQVPDSAFTFQPKRWQGAEALLGPDQPGEKLVGITVRAWLPNREQNAYERAIAGFVERVSERPDVRVAMVPQVTATDQNDDDRAVGERIQHLLGPKLNVTILDNRLTHYEIKSVFDRLTYLVGTRFHSVIFALTSTVPAIAIEYEHKTSGIMRDLGLEKWVLRIEDVTAENLTELFDELVAERNAYLQHLNKVMPNYIAAAGRAGALIKESYDKLTTSSLQRP